jgi:hypothetical protein
MVDVARASAVYRARANHATARALSIGAALCADLGLLWLLYGRAQFNPPFGDVEMFWVRLVAGFGAYAVLQQWTLANQTGRGDDIAAALDKLTAISPLLVAVGLEAYWIGVGQCADLSWRHHAAALLWTSFALVDFVATATTNRRLKTQRRGGRNLGTGQSER